MAWTAPQGYAELRSAIRSGDAAGVRALIARGIDLNMRAVDGSTPVMWAGERKAPDIVAILIQAGADVTLRTLQGYSAIAMAYFAGETTGMGVVGPDVVKVVQLLRDAGCPDR